MFPGFLVDPLDRGGPWSAVSQVWRDILSSGLAGRVEVRLDSALSLLVVADWAEGVKLQQQVHA